MSEIAGAVLPLLEGDTALCAGNKHLKDEVEAALKAELGWSRFLDVWRGGSPDARRELLADLLYRRPKLAVTLVHSLLGDRYPGFIDQLANRIRRAEPGAATALCDFLSDDELRSALLISPERVLMFAEQFALPVPLSTAEHVLWSAAQNAGESDTTRLRYLMSRLLRLREQLETVGHAVDRSSDVALVTERTGYHNAVDREVERTEDSMRRLERLLAGLRTSAPAPKRAHRTAFLVHCRPRTA